MFWYNQFILRNSFLRNCPKVIKSAVDACQVNAIMEKNIKFDVKTSVKFDSASVRLDPLLLFQCLVVAPKALDDGRVFTNMKYVVIHQPF